MQAVSISFVPLFRNLNRTPPDCVRIHLFCSGQCWFDCLPSRDTLVYTIVRVDTSERTIRETPLAGIETVALVDEGSVVALASQGLATEDRLSPITVARPFIQDKNSREVLNIKNSLQQLARQVVECHARTLGAHVQRSQLFAAPARNLDTAKLDSKIFCVLNERVGHFNHFHARHGQAECQPRLVASISFASTLMCCGLFWNLVT